MQQAEISIQKGIPMPTNVSKGNTRVQSITSNLLLVMGMMSAGDSVLLPSNTLAEAEKERRDTLFCMNKVGLYLGKKAVLAAVTENVEVEIPAKKEGGKPTKEVKVVYGLRIWVTQATGTKVVPEATAGNLNFFAPIYKAEEELALKAAEKAAKDVAPKAPKAPKKVAEVKAPKAGKGK